MAQAQLRFSSMLAHEIRTPLNTITGLVDEMYQIGNSASCHAKNCSNEIVGLKESTEFLYELVNGVLDYNKLKEKKLALNRERFSIQYLFETLEQFYSTRAGQKNLSLRFVISEETPNWIEADPVRLRQILGNLIDNAIKFTAMGSVTVMAKVVKSGLKEPQLVFRVTDTGIGIKKSSLNKIFEAFSQADKGISKKYGGTGIGLALCRELARVMNGQIRVESTEGVGSTFTLFLPLDSTQTDQTASQGKQSKPVFAMRHKVLMVEDHQLNAKINRRILESAGMDVDWVETGEDAVDAIDHVEYNIILMDLQLGDGINGYEASRQIHAKKAEACPPILALTASVLDEELSAKLAAAGIDGALEKPFKKEEAIRQINQAVKSRLIDC